MAERMLEDAENRFHTQLLHAFETIVCELLWLD